MTTQAKEPFASYAKLELMGHLSFVGYVEEVEVFGITMVAIDPIDEDGQQGRRRYFGPSAIYSLTPTTEEEITSAIQRKRDAVERRQRLMAPRPQAVVEEATAMPQGELCHQCYERPAVAGEALCPECYEARYGPDDEGEEA